MNTKLNTSQRLKARHLYLIKGFTQKETAKIVGVSEKTIGKWKELYDWDEGKKKSVNKQGGLSNIMDNFFIYVRSTSAELVKPVKALWDGFLKSEEKNNNKMG